MKLRLLFFLGAVTILANDRWSSPQCLPLSFFGPIRLYFCIALINFLTIPFVSNVHRLYRHSKKKRWPKHDDNIESCRISPERLLAPSPASSCTKLESNATINCNNHAECQHFEWIVIVISSYTAVQKSSNVAWQRHRWQCRRQYHHQYQRPVPTKPRQVAVSHGAVSANNMNHHLPKSQQRTVGCINQHRTHFVAGVTSERSTGNNGTLLARRSHTYPLFAVSHYTLLTPFHWSFTEDFSTPLNSTADAEPSKNDLKKRGKNQWTNYVQFFGHSVDLTIPWGNSVLFVVKQCKKRQQQQPTRAAWTNSKYGAFNPQIPRENATKKHINSSLLFQDKRVNILWNRFWTLKKPFFTGVAQVGISFCPENARKKASGWCTICPRNVIDQHYLWHS